MTTLQQHRSRRLSPFAVRPRGTDARAPARWLPAVLLLLLLGACGGESGTADGWTEAQKEDVARFREAVEGASRLTGGSLPSGSEETLRVARRALRAAKRVDDAVLDRMHPDLRPHFRGELQEGLERRVRSLERAGPAAELRGDRLLRSWATWYGVHRGQLRTP